LKNENQSLIDPDHLFNRDRDRGEMFSIRVWLKKTILQQPDQDWPGKTKTD
jgi:hypothetical protein